METSTLGGIMLNIFAIIVIAILVLFGISAKSSLSKCQNFENINCLDFVCPCDDVKTSPCRGYAYKLGPKPDTFYCKDSPLNLVDKNGKPV
jgi:hypothetical protein